MSKRAARFTYLDTLVTLAEGKKARTAFCGVAGALVGMFCFNYYIPTEGAFETLTGAIVGVILGGSVGSIVGH